MALRPSTRKYSQVLKSVRRIFGDEAMVQLDDADILQWSNDAQMAIVEKNKILKSTSTTTSVVGQAEYTFPTPLISQIESITFDNELLRNIDYGTAQRQLISLDPQQEEEGIPEAWYEWAGEFVLFPKPNVAKTIKIFYTRYPEELTGDPDQILDVPDKYFTAIVDYCLWKAFELDEDWQAANVKEAQFRNVLEEQAEEEREASHMRYPIINEVSW